MCRSRLSSVKDWRCGRLSLLASLLRRLKPPKVGRRLWLESWRMPDRLRLNVLSDDLDANLH